MRNVYLYLHSKSYRRRLLITGTAILALIAVVAIVAVNATATPTSLAEVRIRGWVHDLRDDKLTAKRHEAQRNLEATGQAAVPQLLIALRSDNSAQRRNAADMLGYIASPSATEALRNSLRADPVPAVRRNAAWALGEIKDPRALGDLQQAAVADRSQIVRGAAADSFARMRTTLAQAARVNEQFVGAFAVAPSQANLVYLAAKRDLYLSRDGGKTWQTLTNALPGQASALAVSPNDAQKLYAGVEGMGMYESRDGGTSWTAINTGIPLTPGARESVSAIAIDPNDPNTLYITRGVWMGTGKVEYYPLGLMQSRDGGKTWQALSVGANASAIAKLAFRNGQLYGLAGDRVLTLVTLR